MYDLCLVRVCVGIFIPGIVILYFSKKRPFSDVLPELKTTLHIRNFLGIAGFTTLVYAAKYLPIFIVQICFNTAPFWTAILTYLINKEVMTKSTFICMIGCFVGIIILSISKKSDDQSVSDKLDNRTDFYIGLGCIFFTSWMFASFGTLSRKMKDMHFSVM